MEDRAAGQDPRAEVGGAAQGGGMPEARPAEWRDDLSAEPVLDVAQLEESTMGSAELGRKLVAIFLERLEELLVDMRKAAGAGDAETLRAAAHRLKGAAAAMGAARVCAAAGWLEDEAARGDLAAARRLLPRLGVLSTEASGALERHYAGRDT